MLLLPTPLAVASGQNAVDIEGGVQVVEPKKEEIRKIKLKKKQAACLEGITVTSDVNKAVVPLDRHRALGQEIGSH